MRRGWVFLCTTWPLTLGIYEVLRSETEQNLGEGRAEPRTVYPLLYAPTTERRRAQRGTERSGEVIFLSLLFFCRYIFV